MRALIGGALFCGSALLAAPPDRAGDDFVAAAFLAPPAPATLEIAGTLTAAVVRVLGHSYPDRAVSYWRTGDKTAWILRGRSKSHPFTAGFVVERGRIVRSEVLTYRERRGQEIRSQRFLRQFIGAALRDGHDLDRRIDGITGATISVKSAHNLARLALVFDAFVCERDVAADE